MISKILITLAVIVACMMMLSARAKPKLKTIPNPLAERNKKLMRNAAIAFMVVMDAGRGYDDLPRGRQAQRYRHRACHQHAVGHAKSYRVMKNDIHSDGFTTMDGVQVFVAGIERIEIEDR